MLFRKLISAVVFCSGAFVVQPASAFDLPTYFKSDKMNENQHVKPRSALSSYRASYQGALNSKSYNDPQQANIKQVILQDYRRWQGVKYLWGGDSKYGIDCSAFTRRVLGELSVNLPRTTSEQIHSGNHIAKQQLKIGDLVFFKTSPETRHVGVYVGNGQFIHASKSMGVTTSRLDDQYWENSYETSVRVI